MADNSETGIVVDIDHVTTVLAAHTARQVFSSLSRMGLYVVWPYRDYGGFTSGGVRLGNVNIEVIGTNGGAGEREQSVTLAASSVQGLTAGLDDRGIPRGEPEPFPPGEGEAPLRTTVDLPGLGNAGLAVELCAYPEGPRTETVPSGDLAGVQQVDRVVVGARDAAAARARWVALLSPGKPDPDGTWQPEYGPALQVRPAGEDRVTELVVRVRSLATARAAFTAAGLAVTGDNVEIGTLTGRLVTG